jgi:putative tricarboxylic transport membrane protein
MLYPAILMFSCVGLYAVNNSVTDVGFAAMFGFIGYLFIKLGFEPAPLVLGLVLGPMLEENFRRALVIAHGDPSIFVSRPISLFFLILALAFIVLLALPAIRKTKDVALQDEGA